MTWMSAHVDRQRRRDIRRAMGPEALDLVQQQMRVTTELERRVQIVLQHAERLQGRVDEIGNRVAKHHRDISTFWGRLRWLLRG